MAIMPDTPPSDDTVAIYESIIDEYRQALADAQFSLTQSNARGKVKDRIISELTALLDPATDPGE